MPDVQDPALLDRTLGSLSDGREWPDGVLNGLRELIVSGSEESLSQINPLTYAAERGLDPEVGVQLFLHATRAGLMQIHWSLLCRGCGELVANHAQLKHLDHDFYCVSCAKSCPTSLDEQVEVSFSVDPAVRSIRFHEPDQLSLEDYFYAFRFSKNILVRGEDVGLIPFIRERELVLDWLGAGEEKTFDIDIGEGWVVGSPRTMITGSGEPTDEVREVSLEFRDRAFHPRPEIRPGPIKLRLRNTTDVATRVLLYFTPIVTYFDYLPHLSGNQLLNDSGFRRCMGTEVVRPGSGIPVRDNTLLFTDLRGSTEMYDRIGDAAAFELVSVHFESLARVITKCSGVVVKTMGDAIMASFNCPADAVRAALLMFEELRRARTAEEEQLAPKIGVHRGPCIVVNQNEMLDYFGQTVNIAARVQGQAGGFELCVTDAVFSEPAVAAQLEPLGVPEPEMARLKGVGEPTPLYRVAVPATN